MVSVDKAVIARLKTGGETFEILVDSDLALEYKKGKIVSLHELLASEEVFKDVKAGKKASEETLKKILGTSDLREAVDKIIHQGEIQLTTEQRRVMHEEKRKQIVTLIARNSINPQTGAPNPPARIEAALEEARFQVDMSRGAEEQVDAAVKAIRPLLPIRFETLNIAIKIPAIYTGNAYRVVRELGNLKKEEWDSSGDLLCMIEIPAGIQDEIYNKINSLTHGEAKVKVIKQ
jgi:ribosome maturation protein SDO1